MRKLVILSREAGYRVEQDDVKKESFHSRKNISRAVGRGFLAGVMPELDAEFEQRRRKRLAAEGKRWRFVACMDHGGDRGVAARSRPATVRSITWRAATT